MFVIGLTGGIGSGKTTVAAMLRELGAEVIDADEVAREVVEPGSFAFQELVREFGEDIVRRDGSLDRRALARKAFADEHSQDKLNRIVHPAVKRRVDRIVAKIREKNPRSVVVIDAPLLLEAGMEDGVDEVWVAVADEKQQLERTLARDKLTSREVQERMKVQMPIEKKLARADRIIDNTGTLQQTRKQVLKNWRALQSN